MSRTRSPNFSTPPAQPRAGALRHPAAQRRRRDRHAGARRCAGTRRRGPARLQRRPPRPDPRAAAAADRARAARGTADRDAADPGVPDLMHHKYAIRDRRRSGRVDELVAGFLVSARKRRRDRRLAGACIRIRAQLRRALGDRGRDRLRQGRAAAGRRGRIEVRPWFTPEHGEPLAHRIAKRIGQASAFESPRRC